METDRWRLIEEHFDAALALPPEKRVAFVAQVAAGDASLKGELEELLRTHERAGDFLEEGPLVPGTPAAHASLDPDARIGAWRIVRLIGHGGMGEVYEAARADGQFEQRAALKLTRGESSKWLERFNAERQILARLDHPGIARLLDGGVAPDGRPYAVMEFVDGLAITDYCREHHASLEARLTLFLQVCDAVAHAHQNLIVHRDIKPRNVLVGTDARARLLDFGIARALDSANAQPAEAILTPEYAAPEQLAGEPITTATDVYALGMLLFELLVDRRPWTTGRSMLQISGGDLATPAPLASRTAESMDSAPVAARRLRGDLDAIVAKCLHRKPQDRYATVSALKLDLESSLRGDAVRARGDAPSYLLGRFLYRYRWATASVAIIALLLAGGIAAALWQAERASREARRATAARDFLISVFRESDPRVARDRPAGQITAKELLDQSVERIETSLPDDPETQLELLGVANLIYGYWLDEERFAATLERRKAIAGKSFGPDHPVFIESATIEAWEAIYEQDFALANRKLAEADRLIKKTGQEGTVLRADWWLAQAEALKTAAPDQRMQALDSAVQLFTKLTPDSANLAIALTNSAIALQVREDFAGAKQRNEKAIAVFLRAKDRDDGDLAMTYANLARSLQDLGEFAAAETAYERFAVLIRKTHGESHASYWRGTADHARLVHLRGEPERAHRMFDALLAGIPANWKTTTDGDVAREYYAERLAAEGRVTEAIPLLEVAERSYIERPMREYDLRRVRQTLGDAYDKAGRIDDARRALGEARQERMRKDAPDSIAVLSVRERWARLLLDHGDAAGASTELTQVLNAGGARKVAPLALAQSDLARLAIARGDKREALSRSTKALELLDGITGLYDVRIGPELWRVHAEGLALGGDTEGAKDWVARAREASARYGVPVSAAP